MIRPSIMLICRPGPPPSRRRRPNPAKRLDPSRLLSESSTSRTSNRRSSAPHRSVLQRMTIFRAFSHLIVDPYTEAWHVVTTVDAFLDSDEEDIDEPARHAYGASSRHPTPLSMSADPSIPDFFYFSAMRLQVLADFHQTITADRPRQWQRASAT